MQNFSGKSWFSNSITLILALLPLVAQSSAGAASLTDVDLGAGIRLGTGHTPNEQREAVVAPVKRRTYRPADGSRQFEFALMTDANAIRIFEGKDAEFHVGIGGFGVSGSFAQQTTQSGSNDSLTFLMREIIRFPDETLTKTVPLPEVARLYAQDTHKFVERYGEYYVFSRVPQAMLVLTVTVTKIDSDVLRKMKAEASGHYFNSGLSAGVQKAFEEAHKEGRLNVALRTEGGFRFTEEQTQKLTELIAAGNMNAAGAMLSSCVDSVAEIRPLYTDYEIRRTDSLFPAARADTALAGEMSFLRAESFQSVCSYCELYQRVQAGSDPWAGLINRDPLRSKAVDEAFIKCQHYLSAWADNPKELAPIPREIKPENVLPPLPPEPDGHYRVSQKGKNLAGQLGNGQNYLGVERSQEIISKQGVANAAVRFVVSSYVTRVSLWYNHDDVADRSFNGEDELTDVTEFLQNSWESDIASRIRKGGEDHGEYYLKIRDRFGRESGLVPYRWDSYANFPAPGPQRRDGGRKFGRVEIR